MNPLEIFGPLCGVGLVLYGLLYCLIRATEMSTKSRPGTARPSTNVERRLAAGALASVADEVVATSRRVRTQVEALKAIPTAEAGIAPGSLTCTIEEMLRYARLASECAVAFTAAMRPHSRLDDLRSDTARLDDALQVLRALDEVLRLRRRRLKRVATLRLHTRPSS